jgi:Flp pilus assembly protein TadG
MNIRDFLRRFNDDEHGTIAIELVLVTPVLMWVLLSTFVYFDVYRTESNSHRAALTIADMFSREQTAITGTYLAGTRQLLRTLTFSEANPDFRVTVYRFDDPDGDFIGDYRRVWSRNRGLGPNLTNNDLLTLKQAERLPILAHGDRAILVETRTEYSPPFTFGLGPFAGTDLDDVTFQTFNVIRPRFNPSLCWDRLEPQADLC